jgi:threonine aldolase
LCHASRGEEFLSGQSYHTIYYEAGGAAALGGVIPCPLPVDAAGRLSAADIEKAVKPDDFHHPLTRLLCLENTVNGRIQTADHLSGLCEAAKSSKLSCHLDGARLMNAAVASNQEVGAFTAGFDSVSLCLSKGLAAPVGSVLVGDEAFIIRARRLRKQLGGGMRQIGILAAAGHHALDHNISRLKEDHQRAFVLATALKTINDVHVDIETVDTNMVYMDLPDERKAGLKPYLAEKGLVISPAKQSFRLVIHKDIPEQAVNYLADAVASYMAQK